MKVSSRGSESAAGAIARSRFSRASSNRPRKNWTCPKARELRASCAGSAMPCASRKFFLARSRLRFHSPRPTAKTLSQFAALFVRILDIGRAVAFRALHRGAEREPDLQFVLGSFMSFGDAAENPQSAGKMFDRLARRTAAERVAGGLLAIT